MTRDRITVALVGMRFHALVGILPHERELAQPIEIDLAVDRAGDDAAVLDYRALHAAASDAVARQPIGYLETLAGDVADRVVALGGVARVRVAVRKPHVALGAPLAHAEVTLERTVDRQLPAVGR